MRPAGPDERDMLHRFNRIANAKPDEDTSEIRENGFEDARRHERERAPRRSGHFACVRTRACASARARARMRVSRVKVETAYALGTP